MRTISLITMTMARVKLAGVRRARDNGGVMRFAEVCRTFQAKRLQIASGV